MCRFMKESALGSPLPAFGGKVTSSEGYLLGLWLHESDRVFCDKLVCQEDKDWVKSSLQALCKENFSQDLCVQVCRALISA